MPRQKTDFIVVHCSATKPNLDIGAKEIKEWHTAPPPFGHGWKDIGYHAVIRIDGRLEAGRATDAIGAHVEGYNHNSFGICLVGGLDYKGNPANTFTPAQMTKLAGYIKEVLKIYPNAKVVGHRDFPNVNKACPCFDVKAWWSTIK